MTLITMVGAITIILGLTQVLFTDTYIKANLTPVKTIKGVRTGGYITILMGLLFIIFDLITDFNLDY
ncbi:hypothetical protein ACK8P5_12570 [Paenibacillus sp. EC2-1]|uniref:hypothetical protein n=1 Tax=Paenibacillus sp. EC2-1 TaxID=3388665 RepID=UPI003BEEFA7F